LEKKSALAVIICVLSDAPSQVAKEVHPCLVDRSHGLDCDRHKQVGLAEYSIFARLPVCCRLCCCAKKSSKFVKIRPQLFFELFC